MVVVLVTMLRAGPRLLLRGVCGVSRVRGCASLHPAVPRVPVSGVSAASGSRTAGIDPATIEHLGQVSPQLLRLVTPPSPLQPGLGWAAGNSDEIGFQREYHSWTSPT